MIRASIAKLEGTIDKLVVDAEQLSVAGNRNGSAVEPLDAAVGDTIESPGQITVKPELHRDER